MGRYFRGLRFENVYIRTVLGDAIRDTIREWGHGLVLDIGCATKPYGDAVADVGTGHIGVDYPGTLHDTRAIDVYAVADRLPFAAESVDTVLCTEVLEHLETPAEAVREAFETLRGGGVAIFTCPFIWHIHEEPRDFFRYSPYGLRWLFENAGFEVVSLRPLNRFWTTFGQLAAYKLNSYNKGILRLVPIIPVAVLLMQAFLFLLNLVPGEDRWPSHHVIVGRKPELLAER